MMSEENKKSSFSSEEEIVEIKKSAVVRGEEEEISATDSEKLSEEADAKKKLYVAAYDLVSVVMSSFIIIAIVFSFVFRLVGVVGGSMNNTLQEGDWLLTVTKSEYVQGDIIVVTQDTGVHEPLIKRVIATGGQTISIDYITSTVYVDGVALDEPYVRDDFIEYNLGDCQFPYTVPEGYLFCMGDNRNHSTDSRSPIVGPIDERQILGKAVIRILPFGDFDIYDYE
jgi:signal peptidase I